MWVGDSNYIMSSFVHIETILNTFYLLYFPYFFFIVLLEIISIFKLWVDRLNDYDFHFLIVNGARGQAVKKMGAPGKRYAAAKVNTGFW